MTSASFERRSGWLTFAAVLLFAVGFTRIISAINAFRGGDQINDLTNSMFGNHLWVWGVWDLCLAALALVAAVSVLHGGGFGRILAYVWAVWVMVESFLILAWAPWFALATIALAVLVTWGLASTSDWGRGEAS